MLQQTIPSKAPQSGLASRIGIIGGGPAGLSMGRLLKEQGFENITIFEALPQVGGKSFTAQYGDTLVEMGTAYATYSHRITNRWTRKLNMKMGRLGMVRFNGADFMDYVKAGSGPPLLLQIWRYLNARRKLMRALDRPNPPQWAIDQAAMPILDWLGERNLGKMENFMHRSTTNLAYGFIDVLPTVQALRWNDFELMLSGALEQLKFPVDGWAEFWARIAADLDVRLNAKVARVERLDSTVTLSTEAGETHEFDLLVCAIPVDDFVKLTTPTANETIVNASIDWNGYTTTVLVVEDWFDDTHVDSFKEAVIPGAKLGQMLSVRYEGYEPELGGHVYLTGQLTGDYTGPELVELLKADVEKRGGKVTNVVLQKMWKYHSQYKPEAIHDGLLTRLEQMQGEAHTWYTGATFSHEVVSHIVNYNAKLAQRLQKAVVTK
ncbi:MAG: FAD-dependent oxidoreductase [Henriciella sp.]|nr:FAD-dependent oxidoreductase [Henriciella sp.]